MMVVPYLVVRFTQELGLSPLEAVLLSSIVVIGGRLLGRPLGVLADRFPGIALSVLALTLSAGSTALLLLVDRVGGLVLVTLACVGLSVANATFLLTVRAFIARTCDARQITLVVSSSSVSFNLGMFAGAAVAGLLLRAGSPDAVILCSIGAYGAAAVSLCLPMRRLRAQVDLTTIANERPAPESAEQRQEHSAPLTTAISLTFATTGYLTTTVLLMLAAYCAQAFGSAELAAVFFSTQSLALVVALPIAGLLLRDAGACGLSKLYFAGQLCAAVGFMGFGLMPTNAAMLSLAVLSLAFCLSQVLSIPTGDPLITRVFGKTAVGQIMGTTTTASAGGSLAACAANAICFQLLPNSALWSIWAVPGLFAMLVVAMAYVYWTKSLVLFVGEAPSVSSARSPRSTEPA
jgi:MFS family permease